MDAQLQQYLPVLILGLVAIGFAAGTLVLSVVAGRFFNRNIKARATPVKDTAYECGMPPVGEGSTRMSVKFYLVAMLFILFDIEVVFLYPWAVVFRDLLARPETGTLVFAAMLSFMVVLFVGYLYALRKKAFDWKN